MCNKTRIVLICLFLSGMLIINPACERIVETEWGTAYDFMHRFKEAEIHPSDWHVYLHFGLGLEPGPRDAIVTRAVAEKSYASYVISAERNGDRLYFGYGMAWGRGTGMIIVEPVARFNINVQKDTVFIRSLAPMDRPDTDARWFENEVVDLSDYRGMDIKITFLAEAVSRADWWAWIAPVLKY